MYIHNFQNIKLPDSVLWNVWVLIMLFMSKGKDYFSELRPPTGLLFIALVTYENGELRWNDTVRGNPKNSEKNLSLCHFVHHKFHTDWPARLRGEIPATNTWHMAWHMALSNIIVTTLYIQNHEFQFFCSNTYFWKTECINRIQIKI
jgi:hypothetical protein